MQDKNIISMCWLSYNKQSDDREQYWGIIHKWELGFTGRLSNYIWLSGTLCSKPLLRLRKDSVTVMQEMCALDGPLPVKLFLSSVSFKVILCEWHLMLNCFFLIIKLNEVILKLWRDNRCPSGVKCETEVRETVIW